MKKWFYGLLGVAVLAAIFVLALPTILHKAGMHPEYHGPKVALPAKRALVITTSHDVLAAPGETEGPATGVVASELTHPYYVFLDGGMQVDVASIKGGKIPIAPDSLGPVFQCHSGDQALSFRTAIFKAKVEKSIKIDAIDFSEYDIIFLAGGWGAAYDLGYSPVLAQKISGAYYADSKPVIGGVCHGVLGLINAKDRGGNLLIAGPSHDRGQ